MKSGSCDIGIFPATRRRSETATELSGPPTQTQGRGEIRITAGCTCDKTIGNCTSVTQFSLESGIR